jgi:hypothetical protein
VSYLSPTSESQLHYFAIVASDVQVWYHWKCEVMIPKAERKRCVWPADLKRLKKICCKVAVIFLALFALNCFMFCSNDCFSAENADFYLGKHCMQW